MAPLLKYAGSKWRLADWIISHMPEHQVYLEPFFGSGAVFFLKRPSKLETVNDLDGDVVNLFRMVRDRPEELARLIDFTPYARQEYMDILAPAGQVFDRTGDELEDARRYLVRCWMAFGARTSDRSGWAHYRDCNHFSGMPSRWARIPTMILAAAERLKQAQIECTPAVELIRLYSSPDVLIYCDPPYVLASRSAGRNYAHEMSDQDHIELLDALDRHPGPVLLSGYDCEIYNDRLAKWGGRRTVDAVANYGQVRTECLWLNPVCTERLQMPLFERSEGDAFDTS